MRRQFAREKVDLAFVLELIAAGGTPRSGEFVDQLAHHIGCSTRAVRDALAVLRRAGYIDLVTDPIDRRRRQYTITEHGTRVLASHLGWAVLRLARRLLTTCPSPLVSASQRATSHAESLGRLSRAEALLAEGDRP